MLAGPGEICTRSPGRWHLSVGLLRLGLLTRPFDTAPRIDRLWRLWRGLLLPHFLNPLPRQLVEAPQTGSPRIIAGYKTRAHARENAAATPMISLAFLTSRERSRA